jgi:uncharacterized protein
MSPKTDSPSILAKKLTTTRRQLRSLWLKLWGGGFVLILVAFGIAWFFVEPAPPHKIVIASGPKDGAYYQFAQEYAKFFKLHGIELEVRATAGSIANYELLKSDPEVNLAIVQGGTAPEGIGVQAELESLASLYLEPIWVFYRSERDIDDLRELRGMKISVGLEGSGTQAIAHLLLEENGITASDGATLITLENREAVKQLKAGDIDVAFFVTLPRSPVIRDLLKTEGIKLMNFERHGAWSRRHSFLSDVTLYQGVISMEQDIPPHDVHMIAPAANLVVTSKLHQAFIPLLMQAAQRSHERGNSIVPEGEFPSQKLIEFPLNSSARNFFQFGPPVLQKHLPFWIASAIDRGKVFLIPLITLLIPLFKVAPPLYRWRIRSRIYRWYRILREIEADLKSGPSDEILQHHSAAMQEIQRELDDLDSVPLSYMEEFYNLRLHVEFVERRLERALRN